MVQSSELKIDLCATAHGTDACGVDVSVEQREIEACEARRRRLVSVRTFERNERVKTGGHVELSKACLLYTSRCV